MPLATGEPASATPRLHRIAHSRDWPWLPTQGKGHLAKHPWCVDCGAVQVVGARKALSMGGLMNLLARIERHLKEDHGRRITEAQKRLIVKRIEAGGVDDRFSLSLDAQITFIAQAIADVVGGSAGRIASQTHA